MDELYLNNTLKKVVSSEINLNIEIYNPMRLSISWNNIEHMVVVSQKT